MWAAFKLLPLGVKIGWAIGILIALASLVGAVGYTSYQKGLNVSKVEIQKYQTKVSELNTKLTEADGKTTVKVVTEYLTQVKEVEKLVYKNRDVIVNTVPEQFKFSQGAVYAYNQSVAGLPIDPAQSSVATESTISDRRFIEVANDNNGVCRANADQLTALQKWAKETYENGQAINNR